MRKIYIITVIAGLALLVGCSSYRNNKPEETSMQSEKTVSITETEEVEYTQEEKITAPSDFKKISNSDLEQLPGKELLDSILNAALEEIGVAETKGIIYGNYKSITPYIKDIEVYVVTDKTCLIARFERLYEKWNIIFIDDYESGAMYYPVSGKNAVSYTTGEIINAEQEQETEHQEYQSTRIEDLTINGEQVIEICKNDMVEWKDHITDIQIYIDSMEIYITISINSGTPEQTAKEEAEDVVRYLASLACDANDFYSSPGNDDLGSLYKKYTLLIGITEDGENIIYQGTTSSQNTMFWSN